LISSAMRMPHRAALHSSATEKTKRFSSSPTFNLQPTPNSLLISHSRTLSVARILTLIVRGMPFSAGLFHQLDWLSSHPWDVCDMWVRRAVCLLGQGLQISSPRVQAPPQSTSNYLRSIFSGRQHLRLLAIVRLAQRCRVLPGSRP
jgi:hypothetical protein